MITRRGFLGSTALAAFAGPEEPFRLRGNTTVFLLAEDVLDDHWQISRQVVAPKKHEGGPLIRKDRPWEGMGPYVYGSVIKDPEDRQWKCWYTVFDGARYKARQPFPYRIAYATSNDGIRWTKPRVGLIEHAGSRDNNLVDVGGKDAEAIDVTIAPRGSNAPARYVGLTLDRGVRLFLSDDGLRWREPESNVVDKAHSDCHNSLCWDGLRQRWLAHIRPATFAGSGHAKRRMAVLESKDLKTWTRPEIVLRPDEADPPEFYSMPVFQRGNLFFGFLQIYDRKRESLEIELTYSADGHRWHRLPGRPLYLATGPQGSFDSGMVTTTDDIVIDGDRMFTYYGGWNGDHKSNDREAAISRAESPVDRFIGWEARGIEGFLLSKVCKLEAGSIGVNGDVRGELVMAVCDEQGAELPGFAYADCAAATGNNLRHSMKWKGDLRTLNGRNVRLRMRIREGTFYSLSLA